MTYPMAYPMKHPMTYRWSIFLKLGSALLQTYVNTSSVNLSYSRLSSVLLAAFRQNFKVWTKRGVGHGLGLCMLWPSHGPPYGLPVINSRLSIVVNLCRQDTPWIWHTYDSLLSSWRRFAQLSTQTRGRLDSEKPKCRTKHNFWGTIVRKSNAL